MNETTDLRAVAASLIEKASEASSGRATHVVHAAPGGRLSQVILALLEGRSLSEHENPGEAMLHVLSGSVALSAGEDTWDLRAGEITAIPQQRHALTAHEDSVVVLTVCLG